MGNYSNVNAFTADNINTAEKKSVKKIEKGLKRLLIIAAIIFAAQLVWLLGITPFIPFSVIEVHGIEGLNRSFILSISGINENSSFISVNVKEIQKILSNHILVESAVVMKRFPDKLSIFLTPREAVAVVLSKDDTRQVPVFIDRNGIFFKTGDDKMPQSTAGLIVLSGIENPRLNMRLPDALVSLTANLSQMASDSPELLSAISEIRIERKAWDGYELVLFPVHSSVRVRVENNLTEDVLRYMLLMLNVVEAAGNKPKEIDFRSGMGSYTIN
ncbi:MAG: FtsQ-type POTRA domain-containing protein [Treponema sp.]|nr:FtsQ-type POTRA domain-containing protein [Treponema sp.]